MTYGRLFAALAITCVACSSTQDDTRPQVPADPPRDDGTSTNAAPPKSTPKKNAPPPAPAPQTFPSVTSFGGRVIEQPEIVPISFTNDPWAPTYDDFVPRVAASSYWNTVASEYGVGPLTTKTPIHVAERPASLDDTQVQLWLQKKFDTDARFGAPDPNTLYMIYYPSGVTVTLAGERSCEAFGGYHDETLVHGESIGYAVIPYCEMGTTDDDVDEITIATSHELLEWATDPFVESGRAYAQIDDPHWVTGQIAGSEVGDMCFEQNARPTDLSGYAVQRIWSNTESLAGRDPCVPHIAGAPGFFTAIPQLTDSYDVKEGSLLSSRLVTTRAVAVHVGESRTIDVQLYAETEGTTFDVSVVDLGTLIAGQPAPTGTGSPEFRYSLDKTRGKSGDVLHLTITSLIAQNNELGFALISTIGDTTYTWPALVIN
jgi:hypothetical protein